MITAPSTFIFACTLMILGFAVPWLCVDLVRTAKLFRVPRCDRDAVWGDRLFGTLAGITICVLGIIGVVRFYQ